MGEFMEEGEALCSRCLPRVNGDYWRDIVPKRKS
jgi:hypothetical protein